MRDDSLSPPVLNPSSYSFLPLKGLPATNFSFVSLGRKHVMPLTAAGFVPQQAASSSE
jgi:hypothetical protein